MSSLIATDAAVIGIAVFFGGVIALVCAIYAIHVRLLARQIKRSQELRRRAAPTDLREDAPATVELHQHLRVSKRQAHRAVRTGVLAAARKGGQS
jgi:hypothetical protein